MRKPSHGFTLLELLVVIAIIGFLAATLTIAAAGLRQRANIEKTSALIRRLDSGCEAYFTKFQDYPSQYAKLTATDIINKKTNPGIHHDKYMYEYLARPMTVIEGFTTTGAKVRDLPPFVEMNNSEIKGPDSGPLTVQVLDAWQGPIWYSYPGFLHGTNFPDRSAKFDLASCGPNKIEDTFLDHINPADDVTNWTYDRK